MKNLILAIMMVGSLSAQTFDFSCLNPHIYLFGEGYNHREGIDQRGRLYVNDLNLDDYDIYLGLDWDKYNPAYGVDSMPNFNDLVIDEDSYKKLNNDSFEFEKQINENKTEYSFKYAAFGFSNNIDYIIGIYKVVLINKNNSDIYYESYDEKFKMFNEELFIETVSSTLEITPKLEGNSKYLWIDYNASSSLNNFEYAPDYSGFPLAPWTKYYQYTIEELKPVVGYEQIKNIYIEHRDIEINSNTGTPISSGDGEKTYRIKARYGNGSEGVLTKIITVNWDEL